LYDIYHEQNILRAGLIPAEQVLANEQYQPCMQGINLPNNTYAHITGVDMVRNSDGQYYVLEDNLRTPSGVSYMLENRKMMMRLYPEMFENHHIAPVERYPGYLLQTLRESSPVDDPCVVVMTPGRFNSAYFEHSFLAQQMGVELVESADLFIKTGAVYMRTTEGPRRVDVIYRVSTTPISTRWPFAPTRCSACPACCRCIAPAAWCWPTRSAPAWRTISRSTPSCRR
jgi:uncharacterized circularly permuted ATP-grasp superfamily protein